MHTNHNKQAKFLLRKNILEKESMQNIQAEDHEK